MEHEVIWHNILEEIIKCNGSDILLTADQQVKMRLDGELVALKVPAITNAFMETLVKTLLKAAELSKMQTGSEIDFAFVYKNRRFRGNAYYQQGKIALVLRLLPAYIPSFAQLHTPLALQRLITARQGMILVCGRTGSGKTTTLASFLEAININCQSHIITLEDPIEYQYLPQKCFISQRELGRDFASFATALKSALRESPDVIMVGELRDFATLQVALAAAYSGVLLLGTLHSNSAIGAMLRLESLFPFNQQNNLRTQIAEVLTGIFAQELIPAASGGRVCLTEVLLANPAVKNLIRQGKYNQLATVMLQQKQGMQTKLKALQNLVNEGLIDKQTFAKYQEIINDGGE